MAVSLAGKLFVVTGSASGMGYATATSLIARGAFLALCDTNEDGLSNFVSVLDEDQKSKVLTRQVNITDRAAVRELLRTTKEKFGKIDGVAHLAGTAGHKMGHFEIWDVEDEEYDFIMDVNSKGSFIVISEALKPGLMEGPGSIVHVASMFGERGFRKGAIYSCSKHAGIGLVKSAAMEAARRKIRVNSVMPGPIDTPMLRANQANGGESTVPPPPLSRLGTAQEIANVVVFLLSDDSSYVTGASWTADGGSNA